MKRTARKLLVVAILFVGVAGFLRSFTISHAASKEKFDLIVVGMTEDQVQKILGVPNGVRHEAEGTIVFGYGGFLRLKWCTMQVRFGANGLVTDEFHDH